MLTLRPAQMEDLDFLWRLRKDPDTASASRLSPPTYKEHAIWLERTLGSAHVRLYVAHEEDIPVASVRLDQLDPKRAEVSITVAPDARHRGVGQAVLHAVEGCARAWGLQTLTAVIKRDNLPSRALFGECGYAVSLDIWEKSLG